MRLLPIPLLVCLALPAAAGQAPPSPAPTPAFTFDEQARIDLLAMTAQRNQALKQLGECSTQLAPLQDRERTAQLRAQIQTLQAFLAKAHPGYQWNVETGALEPIPTPNSPTPKE